MSAPASSAALAISLADLTRSGAGSLGVALVAGWSVGAAVLAVRGFAGGLRPAGLAVLLLAALASAGISVAGRALWAKSRMARSRKWRAAAALAPLAASFLTGAGLSCGGGSAAVLSAAWLILLAGECAGQLLVWGEANGVQPAAPTARAEEAGGRAAYEQEVVRRRAPDGADTVEARLRLDFEAGSRTRVEHLAFCPPLAGIPRAEWSQSWGPPARIRVVQVLPHGSRIEVRLNEPAQEPLAILVSLRFRFHP